RPVPHGRPRKIARCPFDEGAGSIAFFLKGTTGSEWVKMGKALKLEIQTTDFTDNTDKASLLLSLIRVIREIRGRTQAVCAAGAALPPRSMKTPSQLLPTTNRTPAHAMLPTAKIRKPLAKLPVYCLSMPRMVGRKKPPTPPAAPTMPVTTP